MQDTQVNECLLTSGSDTAYRFDIDAPVLSLKAQESEAKLYEVLCS